MSPALAGGFFTTSTTEDAPGYISCSIIFKCLGPAMLDDMVIMSKFGFRRYQTITKFISY